MSIGHRVLLPFILSDHVAWSELEYEFSMHPGVDVTVTVGGDDITLTVECDDNTLAEWAVHVTVLTLDPGAVFLRHSVNVADRPTD